MEREGGISVILSYCHSTNDTPLSQPLRAASSPSGGAEEGRKT